MSNQECKKTALYNIHEKLGARLVDFHGWMMPVQYEGIIAEHAQVRESCGIFDVSHMGEFFVKGKDAESFLQNLVTNNVKRLNDNQCLYTPMCYADGGVVDDLLIYRYHAEKFMCVVNGANVDKDYDWFIKQSEGYKVEIENSSDNISLVAVQGPKAEKILGEYLKQDLSTLTYYTFKEEELFGKRTLVSRTGYTGEDGFEIYMEHEIAQRVFEELAAIDGVKPAGLGARDTLRFEAKLPLYGHELEKDWTPVDAGLKMFCDLKEGSDSFTGKDILAKQVEEKPSWRIAGLEMIDKGVPRTGYEVYLEKEGGEPVGKVTSGSVCPTLGRTCALALVKRGKCKTGKEIYVDIRGKRKLVKVVKTPFYKRAEA